MTYYSLNNFIMYTNLPGLTPLPLQAIGSALIGFEHNFIDGPLETILFSTTHFFKLDIFKEFTRVCVFGLEVHI